MFAMIQSFTVPFPIDRGSKNFSSHSKLLYLTRICFHHEKKNTNSIYATI